MGPVKIQGGKLTFNGDENNYKLWEMKFLGHLYILKLKNMILQSEEADKMQPKMRSVMQN